MDKPRERIARWMKDGSTLLTQLLEEHSRSKAALTELQQECMALRDQIVALREENLRYRRERNELVEKIAAGLDTASDTLLRFRETLRVADADPAPEPPLPALPPSEPVAPQILVVDDDMHFRSMLTMHLAENRGYEVASAVSGEEALTMLANHQPQAVLLDLMMPGIGGMEALRRMKALYPNLCVVTVTAHEDQDTAQETISLGAADYLKKPFKLEHLDAILNIHMMPPSPARVHA